MLLLFDLTLQVTHKQPQRALNQKVRAQLCALVKRKKRSEIKAKLFVPSIYSGDTFTGCFGSRFSSSLLYSFVLFFVLLFFYISSHDFSSKLPLPSFFFFFSFSLSLPWFAVFSFFSGLVFFFLIFLFYVHLYALRGHFLRWATRSWMPRHTLTQLFWSKLAPWAFRKLAKFLLVLFIGTVAAVSFCFFVQKLSLFCFLSLSSLSIQEN